MPDSNKLGSGVVTALIMWVTLIVYNYSQINYLLQTRLLYNKAANNQSFSAELYILISLSMGSGFVTRTPSFITCSAMLFPIEGSVFSLTPSTSMCLE